MLWYGICTVMTSVMMKMAAASLYQMLRHDLRACTCACICFSLLQNGIHSESCARWSFKPSFIMSTSQGPFSTPLVWHAPTMVHIICHNVDQSTTVHYWLCMQHECNGWWSVFFCTIFMLLWDGKQHLTKSKVYMLVRLSVPLEYPTYKLDSPTYKLDSPT